MNCKFCNKPCEASTDPMLQGSTIIGIEMCNRHPYEVTCYYYKDKPFNSPITYEFLVNYKGRDWCFTFDVELGTEFFTLSVWSGQKRWTNSKPPVWTGQDVNITPENALAKLPTILTFS